MVVIFAIYLWEGVTLLAGGKVGGSSGARPQRCPSRNKRAQVLVSQIPSQMIGRNTRVG